MLSGSLCFRWHLNLRLGFTMDNVRKKIQIFHSKNLDNLSFSFGKATWIINTFYSDCFYPAWDAWFWSACTMFHSQRNQQQVEGKSFPFHITLVDLSGEEHWVALLPRRRKVTDSIPWFILVLSYFFCRQHSLYSTSKPRVFYRTQIPANMCETFCWVLLMQSQLK